MNRLYQLIILALLAVLPLGEGFAGNKFLTIGTGGVTGVYYPAGNAISKLMNQKRSVHGFKVTAEANGGSVFNINALGVGDLDFALAQSDKSFNAWNGQEEWTEKGPRKELRSVFSLNSETLCLIATIKSGIESCEDLRGKIVAVGNPGSGTRQNAQDALSTCGLKFGDLAQAESIKPLEAAALLQDGRLDAFFYTVGHPNGSIKEAGAGGTKVRFIPFPDVETLLSKNPFYTKTSIPVSLYPGFDNAEDVPTFGVKACLLTTDKMADTIVYSITKEVFENFETFRNLHPSFADLKKEQMVKGLPLPLHPGALKYYKEVGLDASTEAR
jgi:uncharacterized protein